MIVKFAMFQFIIGWLKLNSKFNCLDLISQPASTPLPVLKENFEQHHRRIRNFPIIKTQSEMKK